MTLVRFASLCDKCAVRSEEYTAWPTCRECGDHVCPRCYEVWTYTSSDGDGPDTCLCKRCQHDSL